MRTSETGRGTATASEEVAGEAHRRIHRRSQGSAGFGEKKKRKSEPRRNSRDAALHDHRGDRLKAFRWKPGQSGNPNGRPKNDLAREIAQGVFEDDPELIRQAFRNALRKGNAYVFKELADRAYGKVKETIAHTDADGGPLSVTVRFVKGTLKEMK